MNDIFNIILFTGIVLFVEIYSETHIKNYGSFRERLQYLFGIKTIFNITKFSVFFSLTYVLFDLEKYFLDYDFINRKILNIDFKLIQYYLTPTIVFTLIAILSNSKELFIQLQIYRFDRFHKLNQLIANIKYILFRVISFSLTFFIFRFILKNIIILDLYFSENNLYFLDWLSTDLKTGDNYNKGVYFSLILTVTSFFLFNNTFLKRNSNSWNYRVISFNFFKFFFISLMLSLGLFFGFFSIFNALFNIFNSGISEWISKENILGILPIRTSSILITIYLLGYIYKEVLNKNLIDFLLLGILPIRTIDGYIGSISFNKSETLFFSQISFYIINIALAEIFIILNYKDIFLSILNFAILFIVDDFKIINDYSNGLRSILTQHFIRVWIFNIVMLITAISILTANGYFILLTIYLLFTIILFRYYFKNITSINFRNYF